MSYVSSSLISGEEVKHWGKVHYFIFLKPVILGFITVAIIISAMANKMPEAALFSVVFAIPGFIYFIQSIIWYFTTEYAITDRRIILKTGLISRKASELFLNKAEGLKIDQGIIGRIFNYGTISMDGTGGTKDNYRYLYAPMLFRKRMNEFVEAANKAQKS